MEKRTKILIGILIAVIVVASVYAAISKTDLGKKQNNKQTQTADRIKARNEALTYFSEAHMKAEQKDMKGAMEACDKAIEIAPNEPVIMNCKNSINAMQKRK